MECIFCGIVNRSLPAELIYESDLIVAFRDITPQAPTHVLIVPREHIESVAALEEVTYAAAGRDVPCSECNRAAGRHRRNRLPASLQLRSRGGAVG